MIRNRNSTIVIFVIAAVLALLVVFYTNRSASSSEAADWPEYNGGPDRNHYSALSQIDSSNVSKLVKVWEYSSGGSDTVKNQTQMQCNPIIISGILYGVSAGSQAFAIDARNGKQIWKTNFKDETHSMTSRGVTYYEDKDKSVIFFGYGHLLYALDAKTGIPIPSFGFQGKVNLRDGLAQPGADQYVVYNTPGTIFENLLITGVRVSESISALPGDIRAYDVNTGKIVWTFRTIPATGEWGSETWPANARANNGGANSWMGMAIDRKNGIVFAPTGSAAFDFYGGDRKGDNLFANCLIALEARTGKRKWHYQVVHHDIWDRDLPAPPNLVTITKDNHQIDCVAQVTKQGHVFIFNRLTGESIYPIQEHPVERSEIPGEYPAMTQPIPTKPLPFTRQSFTEADIYPGVVNRDSIASDLRSSKTGKSYIPLSRQRTIIFPGTDGGAQWGGAAVDRDGVMYVPAKEIPVYTTLTDAPESTAFTRPSNLYKLHCSACHGQDMRGDHSGAYPSLVDISQKMSSAELIKLIQKGRGMMPALTQLSMEEIKAICNFVMGAKDTGRLIPSKISTRKSPYVHTGYNRWYDTNGLPVSNPPWGTLTAINLASGEHLWQVSLGEFPALSNKGVPPTGTDNYGGPLVTASGLIFIAATPDKKFRAFDKHTGKMAWEADLPAPGFASASTYSIGKKQYIVIACGGGKLKTKSGDKYLAFALSEKQ